MPKKIAGSTYRVCAVEIKKTLKFNKANLRKQ